MEEARIIINNYNKNKDDSNIRGDVMMQQQQSLNSCNSFASSSSSSIFSSPYSSFLRSQLPNRSCIPYNTNIFNRSLPYFSSSLGSSPTDAAATAGRRLGVPPLSPQPLVVGPPSPAGRSPSSVGSPLHARSLSQPAFFSLDSLPLPLSPPPPPSLSPDVTFGSPSRAPAITRTPATLSAGDGFPSRIAHRRSQSDVPFVCGGGSGPSQAAPTLSLPQWARQQTMNQYSSRREMEEATGDRRSDGGDDGEDLVSAYLNLDSFDPLNCLGMEEKMEDLESSRTSNSKSNKGAEGSDNEAESSSIIEGAGEIKEGNKRFAMGDLMPTQSRHFRSVSVDTFMSNLRLGEESPIFPPSPEVQTEAHSRSGSSDGMMMNMFGFESAKFEFNSAELKKIMANEKLAELALADPKRVKRILANRQSAARSKERKLRYITELEHKLKTLQTEATTLSAQLSIMQRESAGLTSQNNELRFRIQAMEQQAQLRDALNQTLATELQRLKILTGEISEAQLSKNINQQVNMSAQMLQLHQFHSQQLQSAKAPLHQMQPPEQQQQQPQQNDSTSRPDSNQLL